MAPFISYLLVISALVLAVPVILLFLEIIAALANSAWKVATNPERHLRQSVAVLVPAHNEGDGILSTLVDVKAQLQSGDRLIVIADNCTDDTAAIAASVGTELIERNEPTKLGKGYALDFGLKHLGLNPPDIVIVVDADCRVEPGAIEALTAICSLTRRPAQALDLMIAPHKSAINYRVAEFAWRVKNWVRPLGLRALSLPCQLMGTGMAFPWKTISSANLATGSLVEDLKLGLELAQRGDAAIFCPAARVASRFPTSADGAKTQRKRWEEGHLSLILSLVPHFIYEAIARKNISLFALTLDMAIPPLSLLAVLLAGMASVAGVATLFGISLVALEISASCIFVFVLGILLAWFKFGRDILPPSALPSIGPYILGKLPIYRQFLSGNSGSSWIRTDRKKGE